MKIDELNEIRVQRLKDFVKENGGAAKMVKKWPEINESYISQLTTGARSFGEKAARKLEVICSLNHNYFDTREAKQDRAKYLIDQVVDKMTEAQKNQLLKIAITLTEPEANGTEDK